MVHMCAFVRVNLCTHVRLCVHVFPLYTATAVRLHCCLIRRVFLAVLCNLLLLLLLPKTVLYYVNVRICDVNDVHIMLYDSSLYLYTYRPQY